MRTRLCFIPSICFTFRPTCKTNKAAQSSGVTISIMRSLTNLPRMAKRVNWRSASLALAALLLISAYARCQGYGEDTNPFLFGLRFNSTVHNNRLSHSEPTPTKVQIPHLLSGPLCRVYVSLCFRPLSDVSYIGCPLITLSRLSPHWDICLSKLQRWSEKRSIILRSRK